MFMQFGAPRYPPSKVRLGLANVTRMQSDARVKAHEHDEPPSERSL